MNKRISILITALFLVSFSSIFGQTYTITASAGSNGSISPSGSVVVNSGSNQSFTITPSSGFQVLDVLVDGSSIGAATSHTFTNVTANHTISATFTPITYTITASAGSNGSISPSGSVVVNSGSNQSFTITPSSGFQVLDVLVDGSSIGAATSHTFTNVTANHTISATFTPITYTITASAGSNGSISPSGSVVVNSGSNQSFTITPSSGFQVLDVLVDGSSIGAATSHTFTNVTANHTISATFTPITYTITASAGSNGSISPSGSVVVNSGSNQSFTITPSSGFQVLDVLVDGSSIGAATSHTFTNVTANHTISATFTPITYTITASAGSNGSISPSGSVVVNSGSNQSFTITPSSGFQVLDVLVDGSSIGAATSHTFTNVTANHTISATFTPITYTITASAGSNGSISPSGSVVVNSGSNQSFTITPSSGFQVLDVLVDGSSIGAATSHTFTNVTANHTISATFTPITYTITASAGSNGSISPSGSVVVNSGSNQSFTITPSSGFQVLDVLVDGSSIGAATSHTFTNVTANHTISATFTPITYTITASAGSNGSISPSGSVVVNSGSNQSFTITPSSGFQVLDVLVDGSSIGAATSHTFTNVTANHTISATFTPITYTITASAGSNGSISPSGSVVVNSGSNQSFTITPSSGFQVLDVLVDGSSIGAATSHTFTNVTANHTISATFTPITYTITASAGSNGSISPSGSVVVNSGSNQSFTITPSSGFQVLDVLVDGSSIGAATSHTFTNVTANHTISATFKLISYTITGTTETGFVVMNGAPSPTTSDVNGNYVFTVPYGWSGTVTPSKSGYTFNPASRSYSSIASSQTNQNYTANADIIISGNTDVGLVTLTWTDGTTKTTSSAPNGNYSITVPYNWSGIVTPTKTGYTFDPSNKVYSNITTNQVQDYDAFVTISGNTDVGGVLLSGGESPVTSNVITGNYTITVPYEWSGTITPSKSGYTFSPASRSYSSIASSQTNQNYTANVDITISGNTDVGLTTLTWTDGTIKTTTSASNGNYSITVPYNWSGTVTPTKTGYTFDPSNKVYSNITTNQVQNYDAFVTISGNTDVGLTTLTWTDGTINTTTSVPNGNYSITVPYQWSGTIIPSKTGYTFDPVSRSYSSIASSQTNQNYTANEDITISGNTDVGLTTLTWTDGTIKTTTSASNGNYSITVPYNWSGTVTPTKTGYTFDPSNKVYSNITTNQVQDYDAFVTISGNTDVGLTTLTWTDGTINTTTSVPNGNYSITVPYQWSGTIIPSKTGYTFDPVSRSYSSIASSQTNQNYTANEDITISGNTDVGLTTLTWTDGTIKTTTSASNGNYSITVPYNWSGTVTPTKTGYTFDPSNKVYSNITTNQVQDYDAFVTISGNTDVGLTTLTWTDGTINTTTSVPNGNYSITVPYQWSGTIIPSKTGYTFDPVSRSYSSIASSQTNQNYTANEDITISGNTDVGLTTLTWTDGTIKTTTSASNGNYSITVPYNWSGTVTPTKTGYTFDPSNKVYSNITTNQVQDYDAFVTISGNTDVGLTTLTWMDGTINTTTSASNGIYSITVPYEWSGTLTPSKSGYTFDPTSKDYSNVTTNQTQNFTSYTLVNITKSGSGEGKIKINNGSLLDLPYSNSYQYQQNLNIEALPTISSSFTSWSGDVISTANPLNFIVDSEKIITANFTLNKYQIVTLSSPFQGGTTSGGGTFDHGATVKLVATPATGYNFTSWTENGTLVSNDSSFSFTAMTQRTLSANFTKKKYNATISVNPLGSGATTGSGTYDHGTLVKIEAKSNVGWRFVNWAEGETILSTDSSYSFVLLGNRNIIANFKKKVYSVSIVSKPNEGGNTTGIGSYEHGTSVSIVATPNLGWKFNNWTEGEQVTSADSAYTFTILGTRSFTANFSKKVYTISTSSSPNEGGVTSGDSTYTHGDNVTLRAIPNVIIGYEFVNWTENGNPVSTSSTYSFIATNNRTLVANFKLKTYTVTLSTNPAEGGTLGGAGTYTHGDSVSIVATPADGWLFANWTEEGVNISDSTTFTFRITGNRNIIANFAHELYSVLATPDPLGAGIISGAGTFYFGQTAKLIASSNPGWDFDNWTENGSVISSNPIYEFVVNGNRTIKANFSKTPFNIMCSSMPNEGGTTIGCGISFYGETMILNAIPNNGWKFINWSESDNIVSESSEYTFTVERDRNLVANFDLIDDIEQLDDFGQIPEKYYLSNAYPNPFNPETNIQFGLPEPSTVNLYIFNINGQLVTKVMDQVMIPAGNYKSRFNIERNGERIPSGVYFFRIIAQSNNSDNNYIKVGKLVLLK